MVKINFSFENFILDSDNHTDFLRLGQHNIGNFFDYNKLLFSTSKIFTFSPLVENIFNFYKSGNAKTYEPYALNKMWHKYKDINYIISVGVHHNPNDWAIISYQGKNKTLLELLNDDYLADIRSKKAMLLIDQSYEGYHVTWLWEYFHSECKKLNISPSSIIYVTGNQIAQSQYEEWCNVNRVLEEKLNIISSISLLQLLLANFKESSNFESKLEYKKTHSLKLYDCLNKNLRLHRIYNFVYLHKSGLIDEGFISMDKVTNCDPIKLKTYGLTINEFNSAINTLPIWINEPNNIKDFFYYETRVLSDLYLNTWVSLVTESSYFDYENTLFISEKSFKPMLALQPFIICGSKGSLKQLRNLGFKTFSPHIDESYDDLDDKNRFAGILQSLKKIKYICDKAEWYKGMQDILEHNYNLCLSYKNTMMPEQEKLLNIYNSLL
jgi:hypothetical protein